MLQYDAVLFGLAMLLQLAAAYNSWIQPISPLLPRVDTAIAIASWNDTIYFFGGIFNPHQAFTYNIVNNSIADLGANALGSNGAGSRSISGYTKYYTQVNHNFYYIDPNSVPSTIVSYDLSTNTFYPSSNNEDEKIVLPLT